MSGRFETIHSKLAGRRTQYIYTHTRMHTETIYRPTIVKWTGVPFRWNRIYSAFPVAMKRHHFKEQRKEKKIKGKRTRNASLSSCSSWSWSVGAVSFAPMLLTISTNSSKLTFPSPGITKKIKRKETYHARVASVFCFWVNFPFLFCFFFFLHIIQQDGCHLSRNAIHPESPLFSRFPRFYYSFFLFLTNNTLYILYTVHFFINTSTLFLLYLDKNLPFYSKERFYYSLSPFLFYFAGAIRKTTCFLSGKRVERVMMREHKPRYRRD